MAAAGAPAARCLTVLLTLTLLLGLLGQALGHQGAAVDAILPSARRGDPLAKLMLMMDDSDFGICMAEREARREEAAAAAREASLQELVKLVQAGQEDLRAVIENTTQETLKGVADQLAALQQMSGEVTSLRREVAAQGSLLESLTTLAKCPDGWVRYKFSCYLVEGTNRTWEDSLAYCRRLGGDLAKITSAEEQEFIKAHLNGRYGYWIGLNDRAMEGHLVWTDGSAPVYTTWHEGQPDGERKQNCVGMWKEDDYKWWDYNCSSDTESTLCERSVYA